MIKQHISLIIALCGISIMASVTPCFAAPQTLPETLHYADIADLALPAKIVGKVRVVEAVEIKPSAESTSRNQHVRLYIEAEIEALIKGQQDTPHLISYLADMPLDGRGRAPKIKKTEQLIFARSVPGRPGFVQLNAPDAAIAWTAERESLVRSITNAANTADSPPMINDIDSGFSVAGTVQGERETQIFLATDSRPVSLVISHHANETPRWSVSLGEIVDNSAPPPPRDTLLWYQLACHLPAQFPEAKLSTATGEQAEAIRSDYALVIAGLGACDRVR